MSVPMVLMLVSVIWGCVSYKRAVAIASDDLTRAVSSIAAGRGASLCRADTVAALRKVCAEAGSPVCWQVDAHDFRIAELGQSAYIVLLPSGVDQRVGRHTIESDTIYICDPASADGSTIEMRGYIDCSTATLLAASGQGVPGLLLLVSMISMTGMWLYRGKHSERGWCEHTDVSALRLTPMQRQLVEMIMAAPGRTVAKREICEAIWGRKDNAEESLYTLVRRTKAALADANIEIVCNRGESYAIKAKG